MSAECITCAKPIEARNISGYCVRCYNISRANGRVRGRHGCLDCGKPVAKPGGRCQPCYIADLRANPRPVVVETDIGASAREGSERLLRRQLVTGKHWITDPSRFAAACQSVRL